MRMLLGVWAKNVRARRFYERAGFEVVGSRSFAVGDTLYEDPVYALRL
jgi:ribosomal protein S18 acetylase RimI-like enzyme